jgi:hypothetical protein
LCCLFAVFLQVLICVWRWMLHWLAVPCHQSSSQGPALAATSSEFSGKFTNVWWVLDLAGCASGSAGLFELKPRSSIGCNIKWVQRVLFWGYLPLAMYDTIVFDF